MANGNLIQGARRLGQSKRFVDYGKVLGEAMKPTQGMLLAKQQYFNAIKEKEAKTQNFIDNLSDLDLTKIPTGLRNQVTDFLTTGRQKYYDASEKAANARMGSEEYRNAVREMNNVNNSFRNLSGGLDNLLERRKEFLTDKDANNISNGDITDSKYYDNLSILGADLNDPEALTLSISEAGDVGFVIKGIDGQDKIINEIPNWNNKASATSDSLAKMSETYNINGQKGIEVTDKILKDNVYRTIGDNRSNIVSLATDSWLGASALINESNIDTELYQGLTGAELLDPANQTALKSYVNDRYYNGMKNSYDSGIARFNELKEEAEKSKSKDETEETLQVISTIRNASYFDRSPETGDPEIDLVDSVKTFDRDLYSDQLARDFRVQQYGGNAELVSKTTLFTRWLQGKGPKLTDSELVTSSPYLQEGFDVTKYVDDNEELKIPFYELLRTEEGKKLNDQFNKYYGAGVDYPLYRYQNGIPTGIGNKTNFEDDKQVEELLYRNKFITTKQIKGFQKTIDPDL